MRVSSVVRQSSLMKPHPTVMSSTAATAWVVRIVLRRFLHEAGHNPQTRIEVEEVEPAVDLVGRGFGDSVIPRGFAQQLIPQLAPHVGYVSLRPKQYDVMAIVHRTGAVLSPAAQLMIELVIKHIQSITEPV